MTIIRNNNNNDNDNNNSHSNGNNTDTSNNGSRRLAARTRQRTKHSRLHWKYRAILRAGVHTIIWYNII